MTDLAFWHRLQSAFTVTYHYLFPQLTMGLAWFLVYWKWRSLRIGDERYAAAARLWAKIIPPKRTSACLVTAAENACIEPSLCPNRKIGLHSWRFARTSNAAFASST